MNLALPEYPGRCVMVYRDLRADLWWMYFLTGRSDASRDRRLRFAVDRLLVESTVSGVPDDLRHYACTRSSPLGVVVGNGDHVDLLASAQDLAKAIQQIDPEPDAPIHTPRIAVVIPEGLGATDVVAVRRLDHQIDRQTASVNLDLGEGVVLHTYGGTADDVRVDALPRSFTADVEASQLASAVWSELEPSLRVAMAYGRAGTPEPSSILS